MTLKHDEHALMEQYYEEANRRVMQSLDILVPQPEGLSDHKWSQLIGMYTAYRLYKEGKATKTIWL